MSICGDTEAKLASSMPLVHGRAERVKQPWKCNMVGVGGSNCLSLHMFFVKLRTMKIGLVQNERMLVPCRNWYSKVAVYVI